MRKSDFSILLFLGLIFLLTGCGKNEELDRGYPRLNTLEVTDISKNGAVFNAEIISGTQYEILKYGFVWSETIDPDLNNSDRVVFSDDIKSGIFSAKISSTIKEGIKYYVRPFIITEEYTVYGKNVEFVSLGSNAPELISFAPLTGSWGDTIKIYGNNFSYVKSKNIVTLGSLKCDVIDSSDTLLTVLVPSRINFSPVKIGVSILGNSTFSENYFTYLVPEINEIFPLAGTYGDTLIIRGENFGVGKEASFVKIGGIVAYIISYTPNEIKVLIPQNLNLKSNPVQILTNGYNRTFEKQFMLNAPVISYFEPDTVFRRGETVTIYGRNFCPSKMINIVKIGGYTANVLEASGNYLKVTLPAELIPNYYYSEMKDVSVNVSVAGQTSESLKYLSVYYYSRWTRKKDFPGAPRFSAAAFSANGKGYYGTGITYLNQGILSDFWEYDPKKDEWTRINDYPGGNRSGTSSFSIDEKGYVGLGSNQNYTSGATLFYNDFYRYDPAVGEWTAVADYAGEARHLAATFVTDNCAYVGTGGTLNGRTSDVWKYDPVANVWTAAPPFLHITDMAVGFSVSNKGYFYDYDALYGLADNVWSEISTSLYLTSWNNLSFTLGDHAFIGFGNDHHGGSIRIYEYDPVSNNVVVHLFDYEHRREAASVFVLDEIVYIIGGYGDECLKDVWEFNPSKPDL